MQEGFFDFRGKKYGSKEEAEMMQRIYLREQQEMEIRMMFEAARSGQSSASASGAGGGAALSNNFFTSIIVDPLNDYAEIYMETNEDPIPEITVKWGDGTSETWDGTGEDNTFYHQYAEAGTYDVQIYGPGTGLVTNISLYRLGNVEAASFSDFTILNNLHISDFPSTGVMDCSNFPSTLTILSIENSPSLVSFSCAIPLQYLDITSTGISQSGFEINWSELENLDINTNNFTSVDFIDEYISDINSVYLGNNPITVVNWPTATRIPSNCLANCELLTDFSANQATIAYGACFENCSSLTTVSLPLLTSAGGSQIFRNCTGLASISLPLLVSGAPGLFEGCTSLTSVYLPLLESLNFLFFKDCTSLSNVSLPAVTSTETLCFSGSGIAILNLPACTGLGGSVFSDGVFAGVSSGNVVTLTINSSRETCNSGIPDGDIISLLSLNAGSSVIYV